MVDLQASNEKLRDRSVRIVMEMTHLGRTGAKRVLARAGGKVKPAIVMHFRKVNLKEALTILDKCNQSLREAMKETL